MTRNQVVLIAISGCSSSGKTTIAKFLNQLFPQSILLHEDDFYKHDEEVPLDPKYGIRNWDSPDALDMKSFEKELDWIKQTGQISKELIHNGNVDDIEKFDIEQDFLANLKKQCASVTSTAKIVIVDGFMIYHSPLITSKFDVKILIRAPYEVLKKRRAARPGYQTLDSYWVDPPYYFDEFVYRAYREAHAQLFIGNDVEGKMDRAKADGIIDFFNDDEVSIETALRWTTQRIIDFLSGSSYA
ncbi:hypothetical protein HG537_0C03030 [Torulaspora globosa]|uniref:Phosphoribulokinase/uridine kinase domain-containing protein n=1 Tax=Torulaspora globosa TaxID=48254 RepID=A0A7H9HTC6_9SACH|nr:hypothetical protein HG537_0C03030 [Torulaspora sp. CBS 2947]